MSKRMKSARALAAGFLAVLFLFFVNAAVFAIEKPITGTKRKLSKLVLVLSGGMAFDKSLSSDPDPNDKGPIGGVALQKWFSQGLGLELAGSYFFHATDGIEEILSKGTLHLVPLQLNLLLRLFLSRDLAVCLFGGVHYQFNLFKIDSGALSEWSAVGFSIEEKIDPKIGYQAGLGLDLALSRGLTIGLEGRYFMTAGSGTFTITDQGTGISRSGSFSGFRLDFVAASLGFKFAL